MVQVRKKPKGMLRRAIAEEAHRIPVLLEEALSGGRETMGAPVPRMIPVASTRPTEPYTCGHCQHAARRDDGALFCCMIGDGSRPAGRQTWVGERDTACTAYHSKSLEVVCADCQYSSMRPLWGTSICFKMHGWFLFLHRASKPRLCPEFNRRALLGVGNLPEPRWPAPPMPPVRPTRVDGIDADGRPMTSFSTTVDLSASGISTSVTHLPRSTPTQEWWKHCLDPKLKKICLVVDHFEADRDLVTRELLASVKARRPGDEEWKKAEVRVPFAEVEETDGRSLEERAWIVLSRRLNEEMVKMFCKPEEIPDGIRVVRIRRQEES